jgi:chromate transporter
MSTDAPSSGPVGEPAGGASDRSDRPAPSFGEALRVWAEIGLLSFGGPAGQIALMHRRLVDELGWIDERRFTNALNFCMLLPGPEATQLATYVGWRLHGVAGGLAAGLLFVAPGALVILALSMFYVAFGRVPVVEALFLGIKAAVLAIVVEALLRIAKRGLRGAFDWALAAAAFVAIFALKVPFPLIVLAALAIGFVRGGPVSASAGEAPSGPVPSDPVPRASARHALVTTALWLAIWLVPLWLVAVAFADRPVFGEMGLFFSKMAVVTFGGAYAVLAYVAQDGVAYGWLGASEMLDGLGLAETTPGPLILVNAFVGYLGAARAGVGEASVAAGVMGWAIALWATFAPCYLWIFVGAPWVEWLATQPRLRGALAAVTAAVVGVILNLAVWFAMSVVFAKLETVAAGPLALELPHLASVRWPALALTLVAMLMLLVWRIAMAPTLAVCAVLALALTRFT